MPQDLNPIFLIFMSYGLGVLLTEVIKLVGMYSWFDNRNFISDIWTKRLGVLILGWLIRHSFMGKFNPQLFYKGKAKVEALEQLKSNMTYAEVNHLMGFILLLLFSIFSLFYQYELWYVFFLLSVNIVFNLYLVFLQQYNKRRINKLLDRYVNKMSITATKRT